MTAPALTDEHVQGFLRTLRCAIERDGHISLQSIDQDGEIDEEWVANPDDLGPLIDRLTAAGTGWQPIDYDAPPAGSVLVGGPGWTAEARWHTYPDGWWLANCDPTDAHDGQCYPTHWTPLPPAPEATRGDGK